MVGLFEANLEVEDNSTAYRYTAGRLPTINMGRPFYRETLAEA